MEKAIVYKLEMWALGKLNDLIAAYNKRADKLGVAHIEFDVVTKSEVRNGEVKQWIEVTFTGNPLRVNGWEFLGTLQHAETGNLLRAVPNKEIPESFRTVKAHCEHCAKYRLRKDTFVLAKDSGGGLTTYKQVGRNCLRDFLGHDPDMQLRLLDAIFTLSEGEGSSGWKQMVTVHEALDMVAAVALEIGFAKGSPLTAWSYLFKSPETAKQIREGKMKDIRTSDKSKQLMVRALRWLDDQENATGFIANVQAAVDMKYLTYREINLAGWAIGAFLKAEERELLTQTKAQLRREEIIKNKEKYAQAKHIGTVGERLDLTLSLLMKRNVGLTDMGDQLTLYKFQTAENDIVTWLTTANVDAEVGETVKARGTVKEHRMYEGVPETALSRVAVSKRDSEIAS